MLHLQRFDLPSHASGELLTGARLLRRAFDEAPYLSAGRGTTIAAGDPEPPVFLIGSGVAYRSITSLDGRRAIIDVALPGDIVGIGHAVIGGLRQEIRVAGGPLGYHSLSSAALRRLLANPTIAMHALALTAETQARADRHLAGILRLDAINRMAIFILGIYDRLLLRKLISRPTFNLPLTQEEIADHLGLTTVHVSRTLRRMRNDDLARVDRHLVTIPDIDKLRRFAGQLPPATVTVNQPGVRHPIRISARHLADNTGRPSAAD